MSKDDGDYVGKLTTSELQDYIRNLLVSLRRVHTFRIIHRDVKPANFLYNRKHRRYSLVDFGLAQEVGKLKSNALSPNVRTEANSTLSPPTLDTPHLASNRTAKRKLTVCPRDDLDSDKKRTKHFSPPSSASGGVLSSTTNRVNTSLRRSPRKQCSRVSPKKENQMTPRNGTSSACSLQDSPCRQTKNADSLQKTSNIRDPATGGKTPSQMTKMKHDTIRGLRRSPRKSMSSASNTPLEGLAKHLQEASALNASNKTPNMKDVGSKLNSVASGESSCASRSFPQRLKHLQGAACSPRVSGINDTRSNNQDKSNTVRSGRVLQEVQTKSGAMLQPVSCHCYGSSRVCSVCLGRSNQHAPRAGTPGFRAPEVLLRHPDQGTAVDMWSVGVILLCLLSGRYPFFRASDDLSTLAEISTLLGSYTIRKAASKFGKLFTCSEERKPLDLAKICEVLRNGVHSSGKTQGEDNEKKEKCSGCNQSITCVCLTTASGMESSYVNSGYALKKGSHSLEYNLLKDQHRRKLLTGASPPPMNTNPHNVGSQGTSPGAVKESSEKICSDVKQEDGDQERPDCASTLQNGKHTTDYPSSVYHLLYRLLDPDPESRITAQEALTHPFLNPFPF